MPIKDELTVRLMMIGAATIGTAPKVAEQIATIAALAEDLQVDFRELLESCGTLIKLEDQGVYGADPSWKKAKQKIRKIVKRYQDKEVTDHE